MTSENQSSAPQSQSAALLEQSMEMMQRDKIIFIDEEKEKLVIFSLASRLFAFYGRDLKEIIKYEDASWVPGMPDFFLGLINLRGDIESVIDIGFLFGVEEAEKGWSHVLITQNNGVRTGIVVDSIQDVVDIPVTALHPPLSTLENRERDCIAQEFDYQEKRISLLNLSRIFDFTSL